MTTDINAADVPFTLNGKDVVLKFALGACRKLAVGGLIPQIGRCEKHDFDSMANTIAAGLDIERDEDLDNAIFMTGLINVELPVVRYLLNLNRGGAAPAVEDKAKKDPQPKA